MQQQERLELLRLATEAVTHRLGQRPDTRQPVPRETIDAYVPRAREFAPTARLLSLQTETGIRFAALRFAQFAREDEARRWDTTLRDEIKRITA